MSPPFCRTNWKALVEAFRVHSSRSATARRAPRLGCGTGVQTLGDFLFSQVALAGEVNAAPAELRQYVIASVRGLVAVSAFDEALPGHLPHYRASQQRLQNLRRKIQEIAALA
jgi:hypothetical protein